MFASWAVLSTLVGCSGFENGDRGDGGGAPNGHAVAHPTSGGENSRAGRGSGSAGTATAGFESAGSPGDLPVEPTVESIAGIEATFDGVPNADEPWSLADSWFITGCMEKLDFSCRWGVSINHLCPNFEECHQTLQLFPLGGEEGETYSLHFTFNAIAEANEYEGGQRDQGDQVPDDADNEPVDAFHRGGHAIPSSYNVWRLRVLDSAKNEVARYYMNSFPPGKGFLSHRTFLLSYEKDIDVPGKGYVEYMVRDANWRSMDNCGPGLHETSDCPAPRLLPNEPDVELPSHYAVPDHPGTLAPLSELNVMGPPTQPWHSQLGHLVVTSVTRK